MVRCCALLVHFLIWGQFLFAQPVTDPVDVRKNIEPLSTDSALNYIQDVLQENLYQDTYLPLLRLYRSEAETRNDAVHLGNAFMLLAKHYYILDPDSMRYYIQLADPLYLEQKRYEDFFRMHAWDIFVLSRQEKQEEVLLAVDKYRNMAQELNSPEGLDMIDQALGNFYLANVMFDDAEKLYNEVLDRMEERGASVNRKLKLLALLYNGLDTTGKRLKYLKMAERLLKEAKAEGVTYFDQETPIYESEFTILCGYALNYIGAEDYEEAMSYIRRAEALLTQHPMANRDVEVNQLYMDYYLGTGDHEKTLYYTGQVEQFVRDHHYQRHLYDILGLKAKTLKQLNRLEEAYSVHEELLHLQDSLSRTNFQERFAEMRTLYDVEKLEAEQVQMRLRERGTQLKLTLLMLGCLGLLMAVFGLLFMVRVVRRSQKAYKLAKEKAEEADRMKSTFLANMNHEIRTPLNAIVGFSQILVEEEDMENRQEYAGIIEHNNELLQRLIADVLDISKIESNSMSLVYSELDIAKLMKDIYSTISLRVPPSIDLVLEPVAPCTMKMDKNRLVQIITNLLTNAIKHTAEGTIRFGYDRKESTVRFFVEDTGEGIPEEQLKKIFDRFTQLENGRKGVGLGLAISKGLVDKMGGEIGVTSTYGKGSVFFFEIPLSGKPE